MMPLESFELRLYLPAAGAMENWGILIFREKCLLVDPEKTSAAGRQVVASVVGHEIAHMWFGNLVTPVSRIHSPSQKYQNLASFD